MEAQARPKRVKYGVESRGASATEANTLSIIDFTEHLRILVGIGKKSKAFIVHKNVVTDRSHFFRAATAKRWSMSKPSTDVNLPDDEPEVFATYLHCLYHGEMPEAEENGVGNREWWLEDLIKLYALADKLGDIPTTNIVADSIAGDVNASCWFPDSEFVDLAYAMTPPNSPLRRLLVDLHLHEITLDGLSAAELAETPADFARDLVAEFAKLKFGADSSNMVSETFAEPVHLKNRCRYHQHDESHPVCQAAVGGRGRDESPKVEEG